MTTAQKPRLSFSQISKFIDCGESYRLRYVEGYKEDTPAWWSVAGSAIHSVTEKYDRGESMSDLEAECGWAIDVEIEKQKMFSDVPMSQWKTNSKGQGEEYWRENAPLHVQRYIDWRNETRWHVLSMPDGSLGIEVRVEGEIAGQPFIGYIDRVFVNDDGEAVIVDLKSGATTPYLPMQHGFYRELLRQRYDITADKGAFFKTKAGTAAAPGGLSPLHDLSLYTPEVLGMYTSNLVTSRETGNFTPNPSWMCGTCGVRPQCRIGSLLPSPTKKRESNKPTLKTKKMTTSKETA